MNALLNSDEMTPGLAVQGLVARHGVMKVAMALLAVMASKRRKVVRLDVGELSPHMLRDLGLQPPPEVRQYWELR